MAEFREIMRQAKRMCKEFGNDCAGCGLASSHCPLGPIPGNWDGVDFANVEHIVMEWAAKHPDPVYPTWNEWYRKTFPDSIFATSPCPNMFYKICEMSNYHGEVECYECKNQPIPADIAEKLGIKPIGAKNDG